MPNGVGEADPRGARTQCGEEQAAQRLRIRSGGVFRDVHHPHPVRHGEPNRLLGAALQVVDRPVFRVAPYGARPDETAALDREPRALLDVGDRLNVGDDGAGRALRRDGELRVDDLAREPLRVAHDVRPRPRKPDVGGIDADAVEKVKNAELLIDRRRADRRRLQAVAERLVHQHHQRRRRRGRNPVPVVNQPVIHGAPSGR